MKSLALLGVLFTPLWSFAAPPAPVATPRRFHSRAELTSIIEGNRRALEAYRAGNAQDALTLIGDALRLARSIGVTGSLLARTLFTRGVVLAGGLGRHADAVQSFTEALRAGCVFPDPLLDIPPVRQAYDQARLLQPPKGCSN